MRHEAVRCRSARAVLAVVTLATAALMSTGCLTAKADLTVDDDGSGVLRVEVFPPPELSTAFDGTDVERLAREALHGVDGATVETEERFGRTVYIVEIPIDDVHGLVTESTRATPVADGSFTPFSRLDLRELPDGGWSLDAVTNPLDRAVTLSAGSPLAGLLGLAATEDAGVGLTLSVTLPGRLTDSNADSQEDDTARWNLRDPTASYELRMRTEAPPPLTPVQWLLLGVGAVFVLGGVLMFVGATGPVKRKPLRKPSRKEHEALMRDPSGGEPPHPKDHRQHAHRRKRVVAGTRTGWEDPLAHTQVDPMPPAESEPGPHPHRPLPPLIPHATDTPPDPPTGEDPTGSLHPFPDSSPLSSDAVQIAHDPAHMDQAGQGQRVSPPEVLPPGPSDDPDYNPDL